MDEIIEDLSALVSQVQGDDLAQDIDAVGAKVRGVSRAMLNLRVAHVREISELRGRLSALERIFERHEVDEKEWRLSIDKRLDDQLALLREMSVEIIGSKVDSVAKYKEVTVLFLRIMVVLAIVLVVFKHDQLPVMDWKLPFVGP